MKYYLIIVLLLSGFLANAQVQPKIPPKKGTQKIVPKQSGIRQTNPDVKKSGEFHYDSANIRGKSMKNNVSVTATLTRESFSVNNASLPQWKIELIITNQSSKPVELGESMILLTTEPDKETYVAVGIIRNRKKPSVKVKRLPSRYYLAWEVDVPSEGSTIWNLGVFGGGRLTNTDIFMLVLTSPYIQAYSNSGFGESIPPGATRTITETFPFPFKNEEQGSRDKIIIVPPVFEIGGKPADPINHSAITFQIRGMAEKGAVLRPESIEFWDPASPDLQLITADQKQPLWLRVFSLNWLAESQKEATGKMLIDNALNDQLPELLRNSSLVNLGVWKIPGASTALTKALEKTTINETKVAALRGLAELADTATASYIRKYITDKEERIAYAAIEAAGKVKDAEAVPLIAPLLGSRKELFYAVSTTALKEIATESALAALVAVAESKKNEISVRRVSILALGETKLSKFIPLLEGIAADESEKDGIQINAITALSSMKTNDAYFSLRRVAMTKKESIRENAMEALAKSENEESRDFLIETAGKEGPGQASAIKSLGKANVKKAAQLIREVLHQQGISQKVRLAAVTAIAEMKITEAKQELIASLNDSDEDIYKRALESLVEMFATETVPLAITALNSKFKNIRKRAAEMLSLIDTAAPKSLNELWAAYQKEHDKWTGYSMSSALIKLKWDDKNSVGWLIDALDDKKNDLWFENIRLLRHLTNQKFGPEYEHGNKKERQTELTKWRDWYAAQPK